MGWETKGPPRSRSTRIGFTWCERPSDVPALAKSSLPAWSRLAAKNTRSAFSSVQICQGCNWTNVSWKKITLHVLWLYLLEWGSAYGATRMHCWSFHLSYTLFLSCPEKRREQTSEDVSCCFQRGKKKTFLKKSMTNSKSCKHNSHCFLIPSATHSCID